MENLFPTILVIWTIVLFLYSRHYIKERIAFNRDNNALNEQRRKLQKDKDQFIKDKNESFKKLTQEKNKFNEYQEIKYKEFDRLISEFKTLKEEFDKGFLKGRRWLAEAFSDILQIRDRELESSLIIKPNPALKAAEIVSELRKSRSEMSKRLKFLEYQLATYEEYFPQLLEYKLAILDELVDFRVENIEEDNTIDPALKYGFLKKEEYDKLPNYEKFQLALDRYWNRNKSNLEIGRIYERYVGYLYESRGWVVKYDGIIKGFEDFGRDLICTKNNEVLVIQCKCWSKEKIIREKYIMQLYGTTILYEYENSLKGVKSIFYSTTALSDEASLVAERLGVKIVYEDLKRFPMIKCNVNHQTKEKIYHLPFDQQYDNIIIGDHLGECYVENVKEAESLGFRRAFKWTGVN